MNLPPASFSLLSHHQEEVSLPKESSRSTLDDTSFSNEERELLHLEEENGLPEAIATAFEKTKESFLFLQKKEERISLEKRLQIIVWPILLKALIPRTVNTPHTLTIEKHCTQLSRACVKKKLVTYSERSFPSPLPAPKAAPKNKTRERKVTKELTSRKKGYRMARLEAGGQAGVIAASLLMVGGGAALTFTPPATPAGPPLLLLGLLVGSLSTHAFLHSDFLSGTGMNQSGEYIEKLLLEEFPDQKLSLDYNLGEHSFSLDYNQRYTVTQFLMHQLWLPHRKWKCRHPFKAAMHVHHPHPYIGFWACRDNFQCFLDLSPFCEQAPHKLWTLARRALEEGRFFA